MAGAAPPTVWEQFTRLLKGGERHCKLREPHISSVEASNRKRKEKRRRRKEKTLL